MRFMQPFKRYISVLHISSILLSFILKYVSLCLTASLINHYDFITPLFK